MKQRTTAYLLIIIAFFFFRCHKKNEPLVTIHCDGLVNDVLPANDSGAVFIANAFTPNLDGMNDVFRPILKNISSESIKIYDGNAQFVF